MLRVPIPQARPGMRLAFPVYRRRQPDTTLLRAGFVLDQATIDRLYDMRIGEIWIQYPGLEFISRYVSPELSLRRGRIMRDLGDAVERLRPNCAPCLHYDKYRRNVDDLIKTLQYDRTAALYLHTMHDTGRAIVRHSADVCYLSLLLGLVLDAYLVNQRRRLNSARAKDVMSLGLAGLFHDIGMLRLPGHIADAQDESDPRYREHVRLGYDLVRDELPPSAGAAILHHHQRWDGSGFPDADGQLDGEEGLQGPDIHIHARIVAAADIFDRMRCPDVDLDPVPTVTVLNRLQEPPYDGLLDPCVLEALILVAPAYPPGAMVRLTSGDAGVVMQCNPEEPCRPIVRLLDETEFEAGTPDPDAALDMPVIDLRQRPDLTITHIGGRDVGADNFYATRARQYGLLPEDVPRLRPSPPQEPDAEAA